MGTFEESYSARYEQTLEYFRNLSWDTRECMTDMRDSVAVTVRPRWRRPTIERPTLCVSTRVVNVFSCVKKALARIESLPLPADHPADVQVRHTLNRMYSLARELSDIPAQVGQIKNHPAHEELLVLAARACTLAAVAQEWYDAVELGDPQTLEVATQQLGREVQQIRKQCSREIDSLMPLAIG